MKAQIKATTYRYKEGSLLKELKEYIDSTYSQHYATGDIQATEDTIDDGHGIGYCIGNCKKYLKRYGKKGTPEDARKDLLKNLHYGLIALYVHDLEHPPADGLQTGSDEQYFPDQLKELKEAIMQESVRNQLLNNGQATLTYNLEHDEPRTSLEWTAESVKNMEREILSDWEYIQKAIEQSEQDQGKNNS